MWLKQKATHIWWSKSYWKRWM